MNFSKFLIALIAIVFIAPSMTAAYGGGGGYWESTHDDDETVFTEDEDNEDDKDKDKKDKKDKDDKDKKDKKDKDDKNDDDRDGEVLGVSTFRFNQSLTVGSKGDAVKELQARLADEGAYTGPVTGYFGPLTRAGVINYQKAQNITPASGFVGKITRAALNATPVAQTAAVSNVLGAEEREALQGQINNLLDLVKGLMEKLKNL